MTATKEPTVKTHTLDNGVTVTVTPVPMPEGWVEVDATYDGAFVACVRVVPDEVDALLDRLSVTASVSREMCANCKTNDCPDHLAFTAGAAEVCLCCHLLDGA